MEEKVIKTKRGLFGRVSVTLPLHVKASVLIIQKKSGIKKAEFLRMALMIGTAELSEKIIEVEKSESGGDASQQPART